MHVCEYHNIKFLCILKLWSQFKRDICREWMINYILPFHNYPYLVSCSNYFHVSKLFCSWSLKRGNQQLIRILGERQNGREERQEDQDLLSNLFFPTKFYCTLLSLFSLM